MTTTRLRRINTPADVTDPDVLAAFAYMPHYPTIRGRGTVASRLSASDTTDYDPLSTEGPNRSVWRLTGYEKIGQRGGRTMYVWRVSVNDNREEFVAVQHGPRGLEVCHAYDYQPTTERTRTAATEKAHELLADVENTDPPARLVEELQADARAAWAAGRPGAPALSSVVMRELVGLPVGAHRVMPVMRAWADAYDAERDAAAAAALAEPLDNAVPNPSPELVDALAAGFFGPEQHAERDVFRQAAARIQLVNAATELPPTLWLCGDCYNEVSGHFAQCEDGCSQSLDHDGACHPREHDGTTCQRCGRIERLTSFDVDNLDPEDVDNLIDRVTATAELPAVRLECLRSALRAESISYGELAELQGLAEHIDPGDVELLEAAGVPEFPDEDAGPVPGSFHDPKVDCCQRDAADCDCTENCERCGATFDPEQAGTTDQRSSGISLCTDCTAHNAARIAV